MSEKYLATTVDGSLIIPAADAREAYDNTPEDLRLGLRERAFMLFDEDELGRRIPIVYQPIDDIPHQPDGA